MTYYDLKISLGVVTKIDHENKVIEVADHVSVGMSPEYAKSFMELLARQLTIYEDRFGKIRAAPRNEPEQTKAS